MNSKVRQLLILIIILLSIFTVKYFGLDEYLNFAYLKNKKEDLLKLYSENQPIFLISFFVFYVISVAVSIPGAAILTIAAGAIFGNITGIIIVSFASTLGATFSFLFSRYLFRDVVQNKFSSAFHSINKGLEEDGTFYLLSLRLIPAFPFFLINLLMGLTTISVLRFFIISQIGMLPGTIVYVNAGTKLSSLSSTKEILSPDILLSFIALGVLPIIAKVLVSEVKNRKLYSKFSKPKSFDYNLVVIGGGAAGLISSYIGSTVRAKVAIIEANKMGGDCLNYGCVPSKALLATAKKVHLAKKFEKYGLRKVEIEFEFSEVMDRIQSIIKKIEPNDSIERYTKLGVDCHVGYGTILSPYEVKVNDKVLRTKNIIIATGASPVVPNVPGVRDVHSVTSENIWSLKKLPETLLVVGAGAIGCEMAQGFSRLGSKVILVEMDSRILPREDPDVSSLVENIFISEGITILKSHKLIEFTNVYGVYKAVLQKDREQIEIKFDTVLFSLGRRPRTKGFGLEEVGIKINPNGRVAVNEFLETNFPNIFACGDVSGPFQFTHTASHEAWYASVNALFGFLKKFKADYSIIPWTIFTDPEVAHVGISEEDAKKEKIPYEKTVYDLKELDRAITESENIGFVKILTRPNTDRILGVSIVGYGAGELMSEFVIAMKHGIGLNKILGTIHSYPTMSEASKSAAGSWKRERKPETILKYLEKFHSWRRD